MNNFLDGIYTKSAHLVCADLLGFHDPSLATFASVNVNGI